MSNVKELPPTPVEIIDAKINKLGIDGAVAGLLGSASYWAGGAAVVIAVSSTLEHEATGAHLGTFVAVIGIGAGKKFYDTKHAKDREEHELRMERRELTNPKPVVAQPPENDSTAEKIKPYLLGGMSATVLMAALEHVVASRGKNS